MPSRAHVAQVAEALSKLEQSTADADARLQALAAGRSGPPKDIRLRHSFVRRFNPDSNVDTSSRKATTREQRPPSTRLMPPRGRALSLLLIALFEAQMRLAPGQAAARNELPLKADNDCAGSTDYIATDAHDATKSGIFVSVRTTKARQIQSSLTRLFDENLVSGPPAPAATVASRTSYLMRADALPTGDNDGYRVPEHESAFFTVPSSLFTNSWIHVLEDSELVLLLIAARMRSRHGDTPQPLPSGGAQTALRTEPRFLRGGAPHARSPRNSRRHLRLSAQRRRVFRIARRVAQPHLLRSHPDALDKPAYPTTVDTIKDQTESPVERFINRYRPTLLV